MALARGVGETRQCPHCKGTILASSVRCPGCNGHLRFGPATAAGAPAPATVTAFRIEGSFDNADSPVPREYTVVISIRNERGEVLEKRVIGVGVIGPNDSRAVTLSVDMHENPRERR